MSITNTGLDTANQPLVLGNSGAAGSLQIFPATGSKGKLIVSATNNTGNTNTTLTNAAMGQASVISIPDPGTATANVSLNNAGTSMTAQVTIPQATILTMFTTPTQLIAAVAGNGIVVKSVLTNLVAGSAALGGGGIVVIQYDNTANGAGTSAISNASICAAAFVQSATNVFCYSTGINSAANNTGLASTGIINKGIFLSNQTGVFTATGTGASLVLTIDYYLVPVS